MLPRGSITRDQLSVLLLEYVAIAADILELFEAFDDEQVCYCSHTGQTTLANEQTVCNVMAPSFVLDYRLPVLTALT